MQNSSAFIFDLSRFLLPEAQFLYRFCFILLQTRLTALQGYHPFIVETHQKLHRNYIEIFATKRKNTQHYETIRKNTNSVPVGISRFIKID